MSSDVKSRSSKPDGHGLYFHVTYGYACEDVMKGSIQNAVQSHLTYGHLVKKR